MATKSNGESVFKRGNSWYHYVKILQDVGSTKYSKKGGFASVAEAEKSNAGYVDAELHGLVCKACNENKK